MSSLEDISLFVDIVDAGSLAAAARSLKMPKSSVSRRLVALETRLKSRLIQRDTRKLSLTDVGQRLYQRCRPVVGEARAAEAEALRNAAKPHGILRVTATGAFGRLYVGPLMGEYLAQYPEVTAELVLLDRKVDLIEEGFDVAVRMGDLDDSTLVSRSLGIVKRSLCASPRYIERSTAIREIKDIKSHHAITTMEGNNWKFKTPDGVVAIKPRGRLIVNQLEVIHAATLQGCGISILPRFLTFDDITAGRLVELLPATPPADGGAHAIWASNRNLPIRTRAFIDFIASRLQASSAWDRPILHF